mmetsp:Transcript_13613/g.22450  ORF Transcript_13613/g.22450 Transcript_13613/m.22450 type:complete len:313 (+) Transcript_13613:701-1639(+)
MSTGLLVTTRSWHKSRCIHTHLGGINSHNMAGACNGWVVSSWRIVVARGCGRHHKVRRWGHIRTGRGRGWHKMDRHSVAARRHSHVHAIRGVSLRHIQAGRTFSFMRVARRISTRFVTIRFLGRSVHIARFFVCRRLNLSLSILRSRGFSLPLSLSLRWSLSSIVSRSISIRGRGHNLTLGLIVGHIRRSVSHHLRMVATLFHVRGHTVHGIALLRHISSLLLKMRWVWLLWIVVELMLLVLLIHSLTSTIVSMLMHGHTTTHVSATLVLPHLLWATTTSTHILSVLLLAIWNSNISTPKFVATLLTPLTGY